MTSTVFFLASCVHCLIHRSRHWWKLLFLFCFHENFKHPLAWFKFLIGLFLPPFLLIYSKFSYWFMYGFHFVVCFISQRLNIWIICIQLHSFLYLGLFYQFLCLSISDPSPHFDSWDQLAKVGGIIRRDEESDYFIIVLFYKTSNMKLDLLLLEVISIIKISY